MLNAGAGSRALLFVGHGTRSEAGTEMFLRTVREAVAKLPAAVARAAVVETAYLELREPSVSTALAALHAQGIRRVALVPVLLFSAGHWKIDLPAHVEPFVRAHPDIEVCLGPVLGEDERLVALAAGRCLQAAGRMEPADALLVVGRGSGDAAAHASFLRMAEAIRRTCGAQRFAAGVLAGKGTSVETAVIQLAEQRPARWVVVPYLLFDGHVARTLPDRLRAAWEAVRPAVGNGGGWAAQPGAGGRADQAVTDGPWVVAPSLGPDPVLAGVLADRAREAWACLTAEAGTPPSGRGALRSW